MNKLLVIVGCVLLTSCSATRQVVQNQDITTISGYMKRCWELFDRTERHIGGTYRIYPEGTHPLLYCRSLKHVLPSGTEMQSLKQLERGLAKVRQRGYADWRAPARVGNVTVEEVD